MYALVTGRVVADSGGRLVVLHAYRSCQPDFGSEAIAIRFDADQFQNDPVVLGTDVLTCGTVHPNFGRSVQNGDDRIDLTVVVQVAEGRATMRRRNLKGCSGF